MTSTVTWVLVADGKRATIFTNDGPGRGLAPVPGASFTTELHPSRDIVSDRPGHVQESAGSARHGVEPKVDYHRLEKTLFARELAKRLDAAIDGGKCQRLVLVAPPRVLGDLRQALSAKSRAAVAGELDKDLTHLKTSEIAQHLKSVLAV
ncbi:MAG: host attachment protein [Pseudomonadota bacterium]